MTITADVCVSRHPDLVHTDVDGQTMMLSIAAGKYFALNRMGSRIWALIEQPARVDAIVAALAGEFEVDDQTCRAETSAFLETLAANGLIVVEP